MEKNRYEEYIIPIIKEAGKLINYNYRYARKVVHKGFANYVTDLDKKIEHFLMNEIKKVFPDSVFISEEEEKVVNSKSYWVIDPIDGTTNLLHGYKSVCISIAYIDDDETEFGCVYCPYTHELFFATKNTGAYLMKGGQRKRIFVGHNDSLKNTIVGFGCPYDRSKVPQLFKILALFMNECDDIKRLGPASLDICYVACGRLSAYIEFDLEIWDFMAGAIILKEAGGTLTDFQGDKQLLRKSNIIASNTAIHDEIVDVIYRSNI